MCVAGKRRGVFHALIVAPRGVARAGIVGGTFSRDRTVAGCDAAVRGIKRGRWAVRLAGASHGPRGPCARCAVARGV